MATSDAMAREADWGEAMIGRGCFEIAIPYSAIKVPSSVSGDWGTSNQVSAGPRLPPGSARGTLCTICFPVRGSEEDEGS